MAKHVLIKSVGKTVLIFLAGPATALCMPHFSTQLDSLHQLATTESLPERCDAAFAIAYDLFDVDNSKALHFAETAFCAARKLNDTTRLVRTGRIFGQLLRRLGHLQGAIEVMTPLVELASKQRMDKELRFLHSALAVCYTYRGQYELALEQNFRSLELREAAGVPREVSIALSNIGNTFYTIGSYDRASEFFEAAIRTDSTNEFIPDMQVNLALCYSHMQMFERSRTLIDYVEHSYRELGAGVTARMEYCLAHGMFAQGQLDSARKKVSHAFDLIVDHGDNILAAECGLLLARIYLAQGRTLQAEQMIISMLRSCQLLQYRNGIELAYQLLSRLYVESSKLSDALDAQSALLAVRDCTINQQVMERIGRLQQEYYQKKNQATIANQQKLIELRDQTIFYRTVGSLATASCLVLISLLTVLLYLRNQTRRRTAIELELRVRQRTEDLKKHVESLERTQKERKYLLSALSNRVKACLATTKGLYLIAPSYELPVEFTDALMRISQSVEEIGQMIERSKESQVGGETAWETHQRRN